MRVVVTLEVDYVVDLPTHNAPLSEAAVRENWASLRHYARCADFPPNLSGRLVRVRAEKEDAHGK